jgi:hypothetical protein
MAPWPPRPIAKGPGGWGAGPLKPPPAKIHGERGRHARYFSKVPFLSRNHYGCHRSDVAGSARKDHAGESSALPMAGADDRSRASNSRTLMRPFAIARRRAVEPGHLVKRAFARTHHAPTARARLTITSVRRRPARAAAAFGALAPWLPQAGSHARGDQQSVVLGNRSGGSLGPNRVAFLGPRTLRTRSCLTEVSAERGQGCAAPRLPTHREGYLGQ